MNKMLKSFFQKFNFSYFVHNLFSGNRLLISKKSQFVVDKYVSLKKCRFKINGRNNKIIISSYSVLHYVNIVINGDNCSLFIGKKNNITNTELTICGNNCKIIFGDSNSFNKNNLYCGENNNAITIGNNNLFGFGVVLMSSDAHPVYDKNNVRINKGAPIVVGNKIWIGADTHVFKNTIIKDGTVIGACSSIHNKIIGNNVVAVNDGTRILYENIRWEP